MSVQLVPATRGTRLRSPRTGGPLRVVQVCARYLPDLGGIETHIDEVAKRLAERGDIELTVLTTDRTHSRPSEEQRDGFQVIRVPAWPRNRDYYLAPGISGAIKNGGWDLVHCQGIHTPVPFCAMRAAKRSGTPYLVTFHTGGHSSATRNSLRDLQWKTLGPLLRGAAHLIGVSRFEARIFLEKARLDQERISVIRNGGGLPLVNTGFPPIPGRIVSSGRLELYKGHHRVIEALPQVRAQVPTAHLEILGAGPFHDQLLRTAEKLGVRDLVTIRHLAQSDRTGMATALSTAQVVAAFSDYEAHPVAVMEALTLGRPVVGYNVAGMADLVEDGMVHGLEPGSSPETAARTLVEAMKSPTRTIRDLPTWDSCVAALVEVYATASH
jgi:glycosyltransferase involved in cell wall biosynthesis